MTRHLLAGKLILDRGRVPMASPPLRAAGRSRPSCGDRCPGDVKGRRLLPGSERIMFETAKRARRVVFVGVVGCAGLLATIFPGSGEASPLRATAPTLGTASSFAVL